MILFVLCQVLEGDIRARNEWFGEWKSRESGGLPDSCTLLYAACRTMACVNRVRRIVSELTSELTCAFSHSRPMSFGASHRQPSQFSETREIPRSPVPDADWLIP